jgi:hypothetical protein
MKTRMQPLGAGDIVAVLAILCVAYVANRVAIVSNRLDMAIIVQQSQQREIERLRKANP